MPSLEGGHRPAAGSEPSARAPVARDDWPRLLELVAQALELPAPDREAWLRAQALSPRLEGLLRGLLEDRRAIESQDFLGELPAVSGTRAATATRARIGPGTRIGPWQLLRRLGEGGMSTVWLAERADGQVRREVALKLPHAGPGQELLARRLVRERSILAGLEHRHIARLYDVGVTEDGVPYLVMEHVEGQALTLHADRQRLPLQQRLALMRQVLAAVQYAHGKLVLHRDLKPDNILVRADGEVKLLDFGIAKILASTDSTPGATELTQAAGRRLTPAYASPEQLRGEPLGTASDVYSLGVVLYELLCGRRPFDHAGASAAQVEQAVLTREPRALARTELGADAAAARATGVAAWRRALAGDLNAVVLKALARDPARRYASVEALDADLARWLAGRPVAAHPPSKAYAFAKFASRHRWSLGLATLALAILATASGIAVTQARIARQEAARAASVRDFLLAMFEQTDLDKPGGPDISARILLENGRERATKALAATPALKAELLHYIGKSQANLSDRLAADRTLSQSIEVYGEVGDGRAQWGVLLDRADNLLAMGRIDEADAVLKTAARTAAPYAQDLPAMGALLREQAFVAGFRHDWAAEKEHLQRYLALTEGQADVPPRERVEALLNLATASARSDDLAGAMARIAQAFDELRSHPEVPAEARLDVVNYRQDIDYQWGRYADIARRAPDEIRECDQRLHALSFVCVGLRSRLQAAQLRLGRFDQALALNDSLASLLDPASPRDRIWGLSARTQTLARAGQLDAHPQSFDDLRQMAESADAAGLDPNYRLLAYNTLAEARVLAQRPGDARPWLARAQALIAGSRGLASGEVERTKVIEGVAWQVEGRSALALQALGPLCAAQPEPHGVSRVQDVFFGLNCVGPLVAEHQVEAAIALLERSLPVLGDNLDAASPTVQRAQGWLQSLRATRALPPGDAAGVVLMS